MLRFSKIRIICFISFILLPTFALSEEIYKFERMWPTLQQPWYFDSPESVDINKDGFVYVADTYNNRIQKFTFDGKFVCQWGNYGSENGEFFHAKGVAVNENGCVYVADTHNHRIQKFTSDGQFLAKWGSYGNADGEFIAPWDIAVSEMGFVYVADAGNHRIQKFTSDGEFVAKWGNEGSGNGEFSDLGADYASPTAIAVGKEGNVYAVDKWNGRIQKFTSDGNFVTKWKGSKMGAFNHLADIVVNENGIVLIADSHNRCIQKLNPDGQVLTKWGSVGSGNGEFDSPCGIAVDENGFVYVADTFNMRIQKFSPDGRFEAKWGNSGNEDGEFIYPHAISVDKKGFVYVADRYRIQKFSSDGQFVDKWGSSGSGNGVLNGLMGIVVDNFGFLYVTEWDNHRIQKFTSNGQFVAKWGNLGTADGQFNAPMGIAVDRKGFVYVVDHNNHRIQKFTSDGQFIDKWGYYGHGDGELDFPCGIAVDENGFIYVSNSRDSRIQKFSSNGQFVGRLGDTGSGPGMFSNSASLTFDSVNRLYVSDNRNNRIQIFEKVSLEDTTKSIIVAGGGSYPGNNLWDATQMCANFAYRALTYQGFSKETIYYLTSDLDLDLDSNGEPDDVDGDATNSNLQKAITRWAADADSLVVYLVDHGGSGTFRMSGTETLSASDLDSWLDSLQTTISGKVIVIYDACESGSFLSSLTPPSEKERIVITSTSPGESAYFLTQGSISFSNYFWTHIFNGLNIKDAFDLAEGALSYSFEDQHPLLDANGNTVGNEPEDFLLTQNIYVGNGTVIHGDAPIIGSVSADEIIESSSSALLCAINVTDNDGIARVWAVIRHPDYRQGASNNPVQELPSIDLVPVGGDRYESSYDGFNIEGTYQIAIYARDRIGNTSIPKLTTVTVENPLRRKAIIVVGGAQSDDVWPALEKSATLAYEALTFQGYSNDDIYFMSPVTFSTGVDGLSTLNNLSYMITTWAQQGTQDVVLYLLGNGYEGTFQINEAETLSAANLDTWLDNLQGNISGKVTIIYDAHCSGSFLQFLMPPTGKERIVLTSTGNDQPAYFLSEGDISFSKYFWSRVLNGANIRDSFLHAKKAFLLLCEAQTPHLNDNSNGIGNEKSDGVLARNYTIGVGIMLAGDDPLIGSVSPEQTLNGQISATIWAKDVTTTGSIDRVWAVINPPGNSKNLPEISVADLPGIELVYHSGLNRYEKIYNGFSTYGTYGIAICAKNIEGNISLPMTTKVYQKVCPILGDINGDSAVDLSDTIIALKVLAGVSTSGLICSDYGGSSVDVNGHNNIGLDEVIYIMQKVSGLRD